MAQETGSCIIHLNDQKIQYERDQTSLSARQEQQSQNSTPFKGLSSKSNSSNNNKLIDIVNSCIDQISNLLQTPNRADDERITEHKNV